MPENKTIEEKTQEEFEERRDAMGYKEPVSLEEIIQRVKEMEALESALSRARREFLARYGGELPKALAYTPEEISVQKAKILEAAKEK